LEVPIAKWGISLTQLTYFTLNGNPLDAATTEFIEKYGALGLLRKVEVREMFCCGVVCGCCDGWLLFG